MKLLTATKVAQHLDISVVTLNNWYKWYDNPQYQKPENTPNLPAYSRRSGVRSPRYWREEDLLQLEVFKVWLPKGRGGVMGEVSARYWGERGERARKNKLYNTEK